MHERRAGYCKRMLENWREKMRGSWVFPPQIRPYDLHILRTQGGIHRPKSVLAILRCKRKLEILRSECFSAKNVVAKNFLGSVDVLDGIKGASGQKA